MYISFVCDLKFHCRLEFLCLETTPIFLHFPCKILAENILYL